jgi:hypothetical protein
MSKTTQSTCTAVTAATRATMAVVSKNGNEMTYSVIVDLFIGHEPLESSTVETNHLPKWKKETLN